MRIFLVPILISASPMLASRVIGGEGNLMEVEGNPKMSGVEEFLEWSSQNCGDCGKIIGSLFTGIDRAKFLKSSHWTGDTLTVTLTERHLYGQVAIKSRLPVMWKLDKQVTFSFGKNHSGPRDVQVKGLGMTPTPLGLELYEAGLSHSNLNAADCDAPDCIVKEEAAVGKYLSDKWNKIKKQNGMLIQMLKNTYGNTKTYHTVRSMGKQRWGDIFYVFVINCPITITSLLFEGGYVGATFEGVGDARYTKNNMLQKMKDTLGCIHNQNTVERALTKKFARSSLNFGLMLTYGQTNDVKMGGNADAIANLFTFCEGTPSTELPKCSGTTKGRIGWTASPQN